MFIGLRTLLLRSTSRAFSRRTLVSTRVARVRHKQREFEPGVPGNTVASEYGRSKNRIRKR